jgi:hypothetical protein
MHKFLQALIVIVGFSVAIAVVKAEQRKPSFISCYEMSAPNAPIVCN